jgi:S-formylglutathione hydrolase FrmB
MRELVVENLFSHICAQLSLVDWWPARILLLLGTLGFAAIVLWRSRGRLRTTVLIALVLVLVGVNGLLAANAYYGYYLTIGQALGVGGQEQASLTPLNNRHTPPGDGVVVSLNIPGRKSGFRARPALVYVPPAWFVRPRPKLPVIVLLHGTPGSPADWLDGGTARATADAWAHEHGGVAPILVMPDINGDVFGDTECVDSPRGAAETYVSADVPAFVKSRLFTQVQGRNWAVAGLSEGGSCATMLALRHPEVYSTFADYGGLLGPRVGDTNDPAGTVEGLFGGSRREFDRHEPARLLATRRFPGVHGFFGVGGNDGDPLAAAHQLSTLARAAGIDTQVGVFPQGEHTFEVWRAAFAASLPWISGQIGQEDPPVAAGLRPGAMSTPPPANRSQSPVDGTLSPVDGTLSPAEGARPRVGDAARKHVDAVSFAPSRGLFSS